MRRIVGSAIVAVALLAAVGMPAAQAHSLPPCNDGEAGVAGVAAGATGHNYATFHIVALATEGGLGAGGHVPGSHHGFSVCDPSVR